jgi:hypothetical protein
VSPFTSTRYGTPLGKKEWTMSAHRITRNVVVAVMLVAGASALTPALSIGVASVSASPRKGRLHVTKECSQYNGTAGSFCTITSSNLRQIDIDSVVFYTQPAGIPPGLLDSNVVLDAGNGDRAVGRCTLDFSAFRGLCTFSDGTGQLTGFEARVEVSYLGGYDWAWDGTYSFSPRADR